VPYGHRNPIGNRISALDGVALLDVIYVVAAIALFGLIALIARAVEKL
jgi:hypothetical protein